MKSKPNSYSETKNLLEKAQKSIITRIEDLKVESMLLSFLSANNQFKRHVNDEEGGLVNMLIQNQKNIEMLETFGKHLDELIEKIKGFESKKSDIKVKMKDITELFSSDKKEPILQNEMNCFINDGHMMIFDVEEKWKFSWDAFWVTLIGIGQIIGGGLLCIFSAGAFSSFGMNLIFDGISDCLDGIQGIISGSFSMANWILQKVISIIISVVSIGITKGIKWIKNGCKVSSAGLKNAGKAFLSSFTKVGWKQSAKHAMKYVGKTMVEQVVVDLAGKGFEKGLEVTVEKAVDNYRSKIFETLRQNSEIKMALISQWTKENFEEKSTEEIDYQMRNNLSMAISEVVEHDTDEFSALKNALLKYGDPVRKATHKAITKYGNSKVKAGVKVYDLLFQSLNVIDIIKQCSELTTYINTSCTKIGSNLSKPEKKTQKMCQFAPYVESEMEFFANNFTDIVCSKLKTLLKNVINGSVKPIAMGKVNNYVQTKVTKKYDNEGYFRAKQMKHKQNQVGKGKTNSKQEINGQKQDVNFKEKFINAKVGLEADEMDVKSISNKTGKKILIETVDENGKILSVDEIGTGKDTIKVRNTKPKQKDGSYKGHYEAIENGKIIHNSGDGNNCLYEAVLQHERINQSPKDFKNDCLKTLESKDMKKMVNIKEDFVGQMGAKGKYDLSGGGKKNPLPRSERKAAQQKMDDDSNVPLKVAMPKHYQERLEALKPLHELCLETFDDNVNFEDIFWDSNGVERLQNATARQGAVDLRSAYSQDSDFDSSEDLAEYPRHAAHKIGFGIKSNIDKSNFKNGLSESEAKENLKKIQIMIGAVNPSTSVSNVTLERHIDEGMLVTFKNHFNGSSRGKMMKKSQWATAIFNHVDEKVGSKGGTNFKYLQQAYKSVHDSEEVKKVKRRKVEE